MKYPQGYHTENMKPHPLVHLATLSLACLICSCSRPNDQVTDRLEFKEVAPSSAPVQSAAPSVVAAAPAATETPTLEETQQPGTRLYVSPSGSDANDGRSPENAFATIARARDEVRALKATGPLPRGGVAVEIVGGAYALTESLEFSPQDSGTAQSPVQYRAAGPVTVHGARVLTAAELAPVSDPQLLRRIDPAVRGKVLGASIDALGLKHAGPFSEKFDDSGGIFELFWNDKRLPLSRWPNEGWTTMKRAVVNGDAKSPGTFEYRDDRPSRWILNRHLWLKGQWRVPWEEPAIRVAVGLWRWKADHSTVTTRTTPVTTARRHSNNCCRSCASWSMRLAAAACVSASRRSPVMWFQHRRKCDACSTRLILRIWRSCSIP